MHVRISHSRGSFSLPYIQRNTEETKAKTSQDSNSNNNNTKNSNSGRGKVEHKTEINVLEYQRKSR